MLAEILSHKRLEIAELAPPAPRSSVFSPRPLGLARGPGEPLRIIAEIKRRSPSAGPLSTRLSVSDRARCYAAAGADMLSVLTDTRYFDGAFAHLSEARAATTLPILCKDFILSELQLDLALAHGADAVLLIVRCLRDRELSDLASAARARGLSALVEVTTEDEARRALELGAELIGVNARDLDTLELDPARAERVLGALPTSVTRVHLSGISTPADVQGAASRNLDAILVGEALMRLDDPGPLLSKLASAARAG